MKGWLLLALVYAGAFFSQMISAQPFFGDTLWTRDYSSSAAFSCSFSPDGSKLAIAYECMGPMVRVVDVNNGEIVWESATPDLCLYNVQFSSNGQYIAIAEELGHLLVIDMTIPDTIYNIDTESGGLNSVDFSADGSYIYTGCDDGSIRVYETSTGMLHHSIPSAHMDAVMSVDVSSSGHYLVSGSKDNMVKVWDILNNYQLVYDWMDPMDDVKAVKFTPDENRVLAGSTDDMIYAYWMPDGSLDTTLMFHSADVNTLDISADGSFAVSGSNDQSAKMFSLYDYSSMFTFTNLWQTRVYGVAISPQMDKLAAANHIGFVIMYDIHTMVGTEKYEQENLIIYPNPAKDFITIHGLQELTHYELIMLNGQVIQTGITGNYLDVSALHNGMYILHIGNSFSRIIKQ
jgi:WD40 repeat protein